VPARWLVKTEPSTFSFADLQREKRSTWDGVSNPVALKHLRAMRAGDDVLVYHTGDEKAVVGHARVARDAYPDPKAKDGRLVVVDLEAGEPLDRPVSLAALKALPELASWELVRISRLSVMPVPPEAWKAVLAASKA
jgi:predicted RNA-binding protein with PUA-like domain